MRVALVALIGAIGASACGDNDNSVAPVATPGAVVFSAPVAIQGDEVSDIGPRLRVDDAGAWLLVWARGAEIVASRSTDGGLTWDAPTAVDGVDDPSAVSQAALPALASRGPGAWIALWRRETLAETLESDVVEARSVDGGRTWTPPRVLSAADTVEALNGAPDLATDGAGTWIAMWEAYAPAEFRSRLAAAISRDDGVTWEAPFDPIPSPYDQYQPQIAADATGRWVVVWGTDDPRANPLGVGTGLLAASSTDGGRSWSEPVVVAGATAASSSRDADARIVTDGAGTWLVAWTSERFTPPDGLHLEIRTARSTDGGTTWSTPLAIDVPGVSAAVDAHPRLAVDGDGRVVALWTSSGGTNEETILSAQSTDLGLSWSAPVLVPGGEPAFPGTVFVRDLDVVTDRRGAWRLVWPRASPLFPILAPSYDLVVAPGAVVGE